MNTRRNRLLRVLGIIALGMIVIYGVLAINIYSSVGRFPTNGKRPAPNIKELIWPTIGYPEIVTPGLPLLAEVVAPGDRGAGGEFTATLKPARSELSGLSYSLKAEAVSKGRSKRWPEGTRFGQHGNVWRVRFTVPRQTVPELYDLSIEAVIDGRRIEDTQRHAVSVRPAAADKDFTFVSLADVHVHRRNIAGFRVPQTDKGIAADGTPVFFERVIDQVNLIRPDFAVILGDNIRAQHAPGDYQVEFRQFYKALSRFQVPVFIIPGNHDTYFNEVDGARVFEENIGPLHYSFDIGDAHFTAVNTTQWPATDRMMMEKFGLIPGPRKWQGQVLGATDERNPKTYTSQLAWLRDDLAGHLRSRNRFVLMHHDPFRPGGKPSAWKDERFGALFALGGGGKGSVALRVLMAKHCVDYVLTGHEHSDYIGRAKWEDGKGATAYVNQTMVTYDMRGIKDSYPGYRVWSVKDDKVGGFTYLDSFHSVPLYDGSALNGGNDSEKLDRHAMSVAARGDGFSLSSVLGIPMEVRGLAGVFPAQEGYEVQNGEVYEVVPLPGDPTRALVYVKTEIAAGVPGSDETTPGTPAKLDVWIR
ncbi:MAG: hypothetical protein CVT63_01020 [Candidatus Anoxymicrobium japonicum]|uniref:Calcineurin-like phosphoesterase domain-containing protein n=1 Tax=Candidatus Anoxymicrobium japonicum TaxID=2013648 RepID=A0A2N3G7U6_9ACTN|nr:MAG: hypothetical protein CVT63_01020 [Candidatus Anoxymicrobium japonicum]